MPSWKKLVTSGSDASIPSVSPSGDFTIDAGGDIILDAAGTDIILKDSGTAFGKFKRDTSNFVIKAETADKDIVFKGVDGATTIEAMRLDMSEGGNANFKGYVSGSALVGIQTAASMTGANNVDLSTSANHNITITGNITLTPTNFAGRKGQSGIITLIQDSSGGHSITLNSLFKTPRGDSISFDTSADGVSLMSYYVIDATRVAVNYLGPFS
mgnify:CR=1 FL=1|tara:strand:+ start:1826 stop:2464 length:639 start_codon:yes stop_codon:yes gene_type:complete